MEGGEPNECLRVIYQITLFSLNKIHDILFKCKKKEKRILCSVHVMTFIYTENRNCIFTCIPDCSDKFK